MSGIRNVVVRETYGDPREAPAEEPNLLDAMRPFVELYRRKFIVNRSGQDMVVVPAVWVRDLSIVFARLAKMAVERGQAEDLAKAPGERRRRK